MAVPNSIKIKKDGVEYLNAVNVAEYYINELVRAALRDTGKFICRRTKQQIHKRTGRLAKNTQYFVRKKYGDLQVGFKPMGFYGIFQELGTTRIPKIGALYNATYDNIEEIQRIQAQYLSALNADKPTADINEEEYEGSDE